MFYKKLLRLAIFGTNFAEKNFSEFKIRFNFCVKKLSRMAKVDKIYLLNHISSLFTVINKRYQIYKV